VDSTYSNRHCSSGTAVIDDETELPVGVNVTTSEDLCNHYEQEEIKHIPNAAKNVMETLEFLAKDDDGFFMMYEQGDVSIVLVRYLVVLAPWTIESSQLFI
jgi:hypothetical protein